MFRVLEFSLYYLKYARCSGYSVVNRCIGNNGLRSFTLLSENAAGRQLHQERGFSRSTISLARQPPIDSGLSKRAKIFEDDKEFLSEIQDEEDFEALESDFQNADLSYKEHKRQARQKKDKMEKMMTVKKFFSEPKAPSMLTWAERMQIRRLHEQDPEEWSVDALAESFPATRQVITKVLGAVYMPTDKHKMQKMDEAVRKNWELLAQDKLDSDPATLAHLKKFLHRREEHLSTIDTEEFENMFQKDEPKKVWNNGQMSSILESYERQLDRLDEQANLQLQSKQQSFIGENPRDAIQERIQFEREYNYKDEDTFKIGGESRDKNPVTLDVLKEKLNVKTRTEGTVDPLERVISDNTVVSKKRTDRAHINNRLAVLAGYSIPPYNESSVKRTLRKTQPQVENDLAGKTVVNNSEITNMKGKANDRDDKVEKRISENENRWQHFPQTDKTTTSTNRVDESFILTDEIKNSESSLCESNRNEVKETAKDSPSVNNIALNCATEMEREEIVKEESSIEGTFFWPSEKPQTQVECSKANSPDSFGSGSDESNAGLERLAASEEALQQVADFRKSHLRKVDEAPSTNNYPQKINIPVEKRGKGLTYKVNDCFYDENGQFLYRVPGMANS